MRFPDRAEPVHRQMLPRGRRLTPATEAGQAWRPSLSQFRGSFDPLFGPFHPCQRTQIVEERHRYRSIILFGMPGSGKGTQGSRARASFPTGSISRWATYSAKSPETANSVARSSQYTSQGGLVPDDLTVRIFERHLNILEMQELIIPEQHILILDGLPRNYAQAERLSGFIDVMQIFHLKINDTAKAIERLRARALRENRLDDMSEDVILRRIQTYYDETFETLSYYPTELIFDVDGGRRMIDVLCDHRQSPGPDQETIAPRTE